MMREHTKVEALAGAMRELGPPPDVAVVLGSGLSSLADAYEPLAEVRFSDLPYLRSTSISGHPGKLLLKRRGAQRVAFLAGRIHLYEGCRPADVVRGVRGLRALGCPSFIVTNAAGAIEPSFAPGELMLIEDHLNLTGHSPLVGPHHPPWGPRFPDLSAAYDPALRSAVKRSAAAASLAVREGVYAGVLGPEYETPAQVRMLHRLGASAVGMSTVLETIAIRHMGGRVLGISCLTNRAAGLDAEPLRHADVERAARQAQGHLSQLLGLALEAALENPAVAESGQTS
jgi:purine-nucleoside phosphorylase